MVGRGGGEEGGERRGRGGGGNLNKTCSFSHFTRIQIWFPVWSAIGFFFGLDLEQAFYFSVRGV